MKKRITEKQKDAKLRRQSKTFLLLPHYFLLFTSHFLLLSGCSTDFSVTAPWKEITVVYGLLNPADSVQYIKINKAFLGEGNALQMAGVADSNNYRNILDVKLQQLSDGSFIQLSRDSSIPKETGTFANVPNILYKTNALISQGSDYKLIIHNTQSGKTITATTKVVNNSIINNPPPPPAQLSFAGGISSFKVDWTTSVNGKIYNLVIRFHFVEVNKITRDSIHKSLDWTFPNVKSATLQGGENLSIEFKHADFYKFIAAHLGVNDAVKRIANNVDLIFTVGADALNTYVEVNQPSTGIVQEKPQFTNIDGGIGLFSSRLTQTMLGKRLTKQTVDSLSSGYYTKNLGFCNFDLKDPATVNCN